MCILCVHLFKRAVLFMRLGVLPRVFAQMGARWALGWRCVANNCIFVLEFFRLLSVARLAEGYKINAGAIQGGDRKSTRLNSSHVAISYAVFCLKKKNQTTCTRQEYI